MDARQWRGLIVLIILIVIGAASSVGGSDIGAGINSIYGM